MREPIVFRPIGVIRSPYLADAPYQPLEEDSGDFRLVLEPEYAAGLKDLDKFRYIYVLYYLHQPRSRTKKGAVKAPPPAVKVLPSKEEAPLEKGLLPEDSRGSVTEEGQELLAEPPWAGGLRVGVFASRSPRRPNPIGLSIVRVLGVKDNEVITSGLDAFDGTPILDIKPYIKDLDSKADANYGWVEDLEDREHLTLHIRGIPHDY